MSLRATAAGAAIAALVVAGCRHPVRTAPAPAAPPDQYCWWSVFRTTLPPDSVAVRFARAFTAVGLADAAWTQRADTAWAHAGPTVLDARGGATYAARVVAFRRGDSTLFRHFVAVVPPRGWTAADSARLTERHIALCTDIGQRAAVHGIAPREPDGEESRAVWARPPR